MTETERLLPPSNADAERAVLGAMMLERDAIVIADELLVAGDYYEPRHARLHDEILALYHARRPVDMVTLGERLQAAGELENVGGVAYLDALQRAAPSARGMKQYADIVRDKSLRRHLIREAHRAAEAAGQEWVPLDTVLTEAQERIFGLGDTRQRRDSVQTVGEYAARAYAALHEAASEPAAMGLRSGWRALNELIRPWRTGQLVILAADTGQGKSAFALALALDLAERKHRGMVVSLEMEGMEVSLRAMLGRMSYTQDDLDDIHGHDQQEYVLRAAADAAKRLADLPLVIDEDAGNDMAQIERTIRQQSRGGGRLEFLVVDYLQLVPPPADGANGRKRYEEVGKISRQLKALAKTYGLVVIALCQVGTKDNERKSGAKRPQLADLYESGRIAQDADMVAALYWPGRYGDAEMERAALNPADPLHRGLVEFAVLKARQGTRRGATASTLLHYDGKHYAYRDLSSDEWHDIITYRQAQREGGSR